MELQGEVDFLTLCCSCYLKQVSQRQAVGYKCNIPHKLFPFWYKHSWPQLFYYNSIFCQVALCKQFDILLTDCGILGTYWNLPSHFKVSAKANIVELQITPSTFLFFFQSMLRKVRRFKTLLCQRCISSKMTFGILK